MVREIVLAWERLRLLYNALLLLPGLGLLAMAVGQGLPWSVGIVECVFVALAANVAFFLGPACEFYLSALFLDGRPVGRGRWLIFGAGLVVSAGVFVLAWQLLSLPLV